MSFGWRCIRYARPLVTGVERRVQNKKIKFAGAWKGPELSTIKTIEKVKAHLTKQEAKERGQEHWWEGNQRADLCANSARAATKNSKEWLQQFKNKSEKIVRIATRLAMMMPTHPPGATKADKESRASLRSKLAAEKRQAGVNSRTGKRKKPPWEVIAVKNQQGSWEHIIWGREDQITCRPAGEAHHTHRLSTAQFVDPNNGQPRPILFCTRCGFLSLLPFLILGGVHGFLMPIALFVA